MLCLEAARRPAALDLGAPQAGHAAGRRRCYEVSGICCGHPMLIRATPQPLRTVKQAKMCFFANSSQFEFLRFESLPSTHLFLVGATRCTCRLLLELLCRHGCARAHLQGRRDEPTSSTVGGPCCVCCTACIHRNPTTFRTKQLARLPPSHLQQGVQNDCSKALDAAAILLAGHRAPPQLSLDTLG